MINFEWTPSEDVAKINFFIRVPYTYNLEEIKIVPQ
jgi:hypothetical protein